jgi:asparagine synthase (glutamine-hydrolysing)
MCGIAGILQTNKNNNQELLDIIKTINHRGPDNTGTWFNNNIALGNTRLKVVDLDERSNQPFVSKNNRYIMIFNGEIYNHIDLKKKYKIVT